MGSTESDRKRRHFSSISPTAAAAKKHPLLPSSEEKKLDAAVLQFQNQKLVEQSEFEKAKYSALENKFCQLKEKQKASDDTLTVVNSSWNKLVDDLESCSIRARYSLNSSPDVQCPSTVADEASSFPNDAFLSRLLQTGATESCSTDNSHNQVEDNSQAWSEKTRSTLRSIVAAINDLWTAKDEISAALLKTFSDIDPTREKILRDLETELKNLRMALADLHLKHRLMVNEVQSHRDTNAKDKAELKCLAGELETATTELEENTRSLATLKAQRDAAKGASFPVLNVGSRGSGDKSRDKQKDLHDMESELKDLMELASSRLLELKSLHEERIRILNKLSNLQNTLKSLKHISSSKAYLLLGKELEKSKAEVVQYQALFEKLQAEKDFLLWREAEVNVKVDLADAHSRAYAVAESRIADLENEIQEQIDERNLFEIKLEEASRELGRKEILAEFKALVSSFPQNMSLMQSQLSKYKEDASEVYSLRAEVQSLSNILGRKVKELESLSSRSADQKAEIQKLQAVVSVLRESDQELKIFLEMFQRESADSSPVMEARNLEYSAWAHVQSLQSSLDEHRLESRVKEANEAEAMSQQRLATAEAEIADLRQKLDGSRSDAVKYSEVLKSKHEEGEAYLSEIESIGQAYEDMQTQNQQLLQQITERDDYNIKLVLEGVKARHLQDALRMEKQTMEKELEQANASIDSYNMKGTRIEDQLKLLSEKGDKLVEDGRRSSTVLESTQKKLLDFRRESQKLRESLEASQLKVEKSRSRGAELHIQIEKERFDKKRIEEEVEVARRKAAHLRSRTEGNSVLEKLQQEVTEYREILKCSICNERPKEVVITKCYHLFCSVCVQKILESRHRKCSICSTSFGSNDVKSVYI